MGGGDWGKFNVLYANEEYVEAHKKELRRFTGKLSRGEWIAVVVVLAFPIYFIANVAWRWLT